MEQQNAIATDRLRVMGNIMKDHLLYVPAIVENKAAHEKVMVAIALLNDAMDCIIGNKK